MEIIKTKKGVSLRLKEGTIVKDNGTIIGRIGKDGKLIKAGEEPTPTITQDKLLLLAMHTLEPITDQFRDMLGNINAEAYANALIPLYNHYCSIYNINPNDTTSLTQLAEATADSTPLN